MMSAMIAMREVVWIPYCKQELDGDKRGFKISRKAFRKSFTGFSSHIGAKLRDWADRQARAGCYSWAALTSNHSKTRYKYKELSE